MVDGRRTSAFPVEITLGSIWNVALLRESEAVLAGEGLAEGAGMLFDPTMNLFRSALKARTLRVLTHWRCGS